MPSTKDLTRRQLLAAGARGGAALTAGAILSDPFVQRALASPVQCGRLSDIEHVVILIQENRSFDHYFGSYRGVAGFRDPHAMAGVFAQQGYPVAGYGGYLNPFHIDSYHNGECTNDINHSWVPQHDSWNGGRNDSFVKQHVAVDGLATGAMTMGYYERPDLEFYYALADAFTVCDHYHCSVIGPTDPNRLYSMSGTLDPTGKQGGPILDTSGTRVGRFGSLSWTTMPEQLRARGISWKVYASPDGNYGDSVLPYFQQYWLDPELFSNAFVPSFPNDFESDCAAGNLPQVSWILAPLLESEHPPTPIEWGQWASSTAFRALVRNPALWARSAMFITHDENGGFFDHVPPPTAPPGTSGEYVTVNPLPASAGGIAGPIGLGFRVPLLIASPFARGGFVSSDTFDHTSTLRFLETRFGAEVPNLSAWRRSVTGDLTSAFNFANVNTTVPSLPVPNREEPRVVASTCATSAPFDILNEWSATLGQIMKTFVKNYPIPPNGGIPPQEPGTARRPSGPVICPT